jgi:diaminohydroxyphosphoribosylaminopyrimidine deaminase/5-amino-6-(5-phosphoribosylamino)uracil reductase
MRTLANSQLGDEFIDWPVYMARAIEIAAKVISTDPNPRVGCVIVGADGVIAEGWHVFPGQLHAETMAIETARLKQQSVIGATAFVSLEPCAHFGRTGPCAVALVNAQIARVVIATKDPNPEVSGKGITILEQAGIEVVHLAGFEMEAKALNPGFHKRHEVGLPWVRLKLASSLDGRTALANGQSKWITGSAARSDVQRMRLASSAIVTGVNSVLKDDPRLTVRLDELDLTDDERRANQLRLALQPLKVILDSALRTPVSAQILASGRVFIFTKADQSAVATFSAGLPPGHQVEIVQAKPSAANPAEGVDLSFVLEFLAQIECNDVLVESGAGLSSAFIYGGWVDELMVYIAPKLMGADAMPLVAKTGLASMDELMGFETTAVERLGNDIKVTMVPS